MSGLIGGAGSKSGVIGQTELDYETGSWTPLVRDVSGNAATLSTELGTYVKVGKMLVCSYQWLMSSKGSMTGSYVLMVNMPFDHPTEQNGTGMVDKWNGFNVAYSMLAWETRGSVGTKIWLTGTPAAGTDEVGYIPTGSPFTGNESMQGALVYFVV